MSQPVSNQSAFIREFRHTYRAHARTEVLSKISHSHFRTWRIGLADWDKLRNNGRLTKISGDSSLSKIIATHPILFLVYRHSHIENCIEVAANYAFAWCRRVLLDGPWRRRFASIFRFEWIMPRAKFPPIKASAFFKGNVSMLLQILSSHFRRETNHYGICFLKGKICKRQSDTF